MILGRSLQTFTVLHVSISLIAIPSGLIVLVGMLGLAATASCAKLAHAPEKPVLDLIGDGNRLPAFAKPASAGEGRSEKHALGLDPRDHAQAKC
jgi:hypothetical protein